MSINLPQLPPRHRWRVRGGPLGPVLLMQAKGCLGIWVTIDSVHIFGRTNPEDDVQRAAQVILDRHEEDVRSKANTGAYKRLVNES